MKHAVLSSPSCACRSASCRPYIVPFAGAEPNGATGKIYLAVVDCDDHEALERIRAIVPVLELPGSPMLALDDLAKLAPPALTARQQQILDLLQCGLSNKQIARQLGLSHFTVRNHVSKLLQLHKVQSRHEFGTGAEAA